MQIVDEIIMPAKEKAEWEIQDLETAVDRILKEKNTNFDSLVKNLENNPELYKIVAEMILEGVEKSYNQHNPLISLGEMYGLFREENGKVKIHNRIYEQSIYNYITSK